MKHTDSYDCIIYAGFLLMGLSIGGVINECCPDSYISIVVWSFIIYVVLLLLWRAIRDEKPPTDIDDWYR